jgi:hypothetical protein
MAAIHWDDLFFVNPTNGEVSPSLTGGFVLGVPKYGNYGGAFNPDLTTEQLLTQPNGEPYSYPQLLAVAPDNLDPTDITDYFYYVHDVRSAQADPGYTPAQVKADVGLITSLTLTDTSFDPEASLYDGVVTAGLLGQLAIHNDLGSIPPKLAAVALTDAATDIEFGLQHLQEPEASVALNALFRPVDADTFARDFTVTTTSFQQELVEAVAVNAVALTINEPVDGLIVDTWSGFTGGTSNYELVYHKASADLDLLSA